MRLENVQDAASGRSPGAAAMKDPLRRKHTVLIDLEKLNTLNAEGCPVCGRKFTLGEIAVLACGSWRGAPRIIHENEAVWDPNTSSFVAREFFEPRSS
jgi:hypothetical protein